MFESVGLRGDHELRLLRADALDSDNTSLSERHQPRLLLTCWCKCEMLLLPATNLAMR